MKKAHYFLFILLGFIPASFLLFMILVSGFFGFTLSRKFFYLFEMLLGISGYLGFLSLLRGLKKQFYKLNLILLGLGLFGFNMFLFFDEEMAGVLTSYLSGKRYVDGWLLVFMLPNIVSLIFIIVISTKMYKERNAK